MEWNLLVDAQPICGSFIPQSHILLGELRVRSSTTLSLEVLAFFSLKQTKWLHLLLPKAWRFLERRASIVERALGGQNLPSGKGYRETDLWITPTQRLLKTEPPLGNLGTC